MCHVFTLHFYQSATYVVPIWSMETSTCVIGFHFLFLLRTTSSFTSHSTLTHVLRKTVSQRFSLEFQTTRLVNKEVCCGALPEDNYRDSNFNDKLITYRLMVLWFQKIHGREKMSSGRLLKVQSFRMSIQLGAKCELLETYWNLYDRCRPNSTNVWHALVSKQEIEKKNHRFCIHCRFFSARPFAN